ncbi:MAG: molybdopterin cofactor-binding domain-containing protein [Halioglobus sp.]
MSLSRRRFIRNVSVAGGALTLGFNLSGCSEQPLLSVVEGSFQPNAFLSIDETGEVLVQIHKAEMGQGVLTGIVTLIAEELEVDPARVRYEMAPVHPAYNDPVYRLQLTGGSNSIAGSYDVLRQVGATARETLLQAASTDSGKAVALLTAENGAVTSSDGSYHASYGSLVSTARKLAVPERVSLKPRDQFKLIGRYSKRVDAQSKSDGSARFGIDAQPDNCAVAIVLHCPHFGGKLLDFDAGEALKHPGVIDIFAIDEGVAVVAEGYWPARKAGEKVKARFQPAEGALQSSEDIREAMDQAFDQAKFRSVRKDKPGSSPIAGKQVQASYHLPFLAHATMEPQNATAWVRDGSCDVWVGSQSPDICKAEVVRLLGLSPESVRIHNQLLGGGFGRRMAPDTVLEAASISARVKRPVKVIWSREDDTQHDFYRPAMSGRLQATVASNGDVSQWQHRVVGPSLYQQIVPQFSVALVPSWVPDAIPRFAGDWIARTGPAAVEGAKEIPYRFDGVDVQFSNFQTPLPVGFWRSVGHSHTAFVVESFIDELAHQSELDPVAFRLRHLAPDSRHHRVLTAVAELAGWGNATDGHYQGVALHESFDSVVAEIAQVSLRDGKPKLERFFCAVDCGQVVNPDIVRDQMEGGIVFGLTAALHGEITVQDGAVQQGNFHDYPLLRHNEMPEVEVLILDSDAHPTGVGEPGTPPAAPALANAIFAATGERHRELPLRLG